MFFNDEYMLTYPEVKEERKSFIKNLITAEFEENNYSLIQIELPIKNSEYEFSKKLECLKDRIKNDAISIEDIISLENIFKNGTISLDVIIQAIEQLEFKNGMNELDEDLHGKVGSFKNLYNVYSYDYTYLKN